MLGSKILGGAAKGMTDSVGKSKVEEKQEFEEKLNEMYGSNGTEKFAKMQEQRDSEKEMALSEEAIVKKMQEIEGTGTGMKYKGVPYY